MLSEIVRQQSVTMSRGTTRRDTLIAAIHAALPASSYYEIAQKTGHILQARINSGMIGYALAQLRKSPATYGWTVPHVKRGAAAWSDSGRYFSIQAGQHLKPENVMHLDNGLLGTLQQTATMMANQSAAIQFTAAVTGSPRLHELAADFDYIARKAEAAVREFTAGISRTTH